MDDTEVKQLDPELVSITFEEAKYPSFTDKAPEGTLLCKIPFPGFYESEITFDASMWEEYEYIFIKEEADKERELFVLHNKPVVEEDAVCKDYLDSLMDLLKIKGIEYAGVTSPKEYNFETDALWAYVPKDALKVLLKNVDRNILQECIKQATTPSDGYFPFFKEKDCAFYDEASWDDIQPVLWALVFDAALATEDLTIADVYSRQVDRNPFNENVKWEPRN